MNFVTETRPYKRFSQLIRKELYPYFKKIQSIEGVKARIEDKNILMFASNSYLGLHQHPNVIKAACKAVRKYGTSCSGSRFLNGTLDLHICLERELADFLEKEAVITFGNGFNVNTSVIPAIAGKSDHVFSDELNHASIVEGNRISFAKIYKYRHNDMQDLANKLSLANSGKKLIVTDGVFSMDGDIAKLPDLVRLSRRHDAIIFVDSAHGIGVLGKTGSGSASFYNLTKEVQLIGGTFSKSLASQGGFIAGDQKTIDYLKHAARSIMFSVSMTPANTAAALEALRIIRTDGSMVEKLWRNTFYAIEMLREMEFNIGQAETPIIPIYIGNSEKTFLIAKQLFEQGIFVSPIVAPAVPEKSSLLRFTVTSLHSIEQITYAIETLGKITRRLEPINHH